MSISVLGAHLPVIPSCRAPPRRSEIGSNLASRSDVHLLLLHSGRSQEGKGKEREQEWVIGDSGMKMAEDMLLSVMQSLESSKGWDDHFKIGPSHMKFQVLLYGTCKLLATEVRKRTYYISFYNVCRSLHYCIIQGSKVYLPCVVLVLIFAWQLVLTLILAPHQPRC